jgi:ribonuclease J
MKVCIHRGTRQIGGSCVEVTAAGKRIIIDLGLPLDAESNDPKYLPRIAGLDGRDDSLLAVIISHGHMDHFGLLAHISDTIPVIMGEDARRILAAAAPFLKDNWPVPAGGLYLKNEVTFETGPFRITPYLTDHSAYDAYCILIEADGKRLFYSGDIRMHGRKASLTERLISNPPKAIDVLLMEGSTLGRSGTNDAYSTEAQLEAEFATSIAETPGLVMVHTSSQNIDRIVTVFKACKATGRRLVIDLYTAAILEATGNHRIPKSHWPEVALFIPQSQRIKIKNNQWFGLLKSHSVNRLYIDEVLDPARPSVLLFRPLHIPDLDRAGKLKDALYIYSQWEGYWKEESFSRLRNWLQVNNIPVKSIHTSGHAGQADLQRFASAINARRVAPIHTFMPERYKELFDRVEEHGDGEVWEV